jgi:hypothetical protein
MNVLIEFTPIEGSNATRKLAQYRTNLLQHLSARYYYGEPFPD